MAVQTGKAGAIVLGAGAVNGKVIQWDCNLEDIDVVSRGAGDLYQTRENLALDWFIEGEFLALDQADWDLGQGLVGTAATVSVKRKSGDTNPWATGTGKVKRLRVVEKFDDVVRVTFRVECNGTGLTFDSTPA